MNKRLVIFEHLHLLLWIKLFNFMPIQYSK